MNYRLSTILAREEYTADTTKVIDINVSDPISRLVVTWENYNSATGQPTGHPARCITKIELVDGSDVLYSLNGSEAQALDFYDNHKAPANLLAYANGMYSEAIFNLNFGRFLHDPDLAIDPKKFTNLQLKLTLDIDAGGITSTKGQLTVLAHLFDTKAITPAGFLMSKEIKDYSMGASSHEYTDLPVDHTYRKLLVRAHKYGTGADYAFTNIKLSEDVDKKIPFDQTIGEILRTIVSEVPPYRERLIGNGHTAARYFYITPTYWPRYGACAWRKASATGNVSLYEGDGGRMTEIQEAAGPNFAALIEGHCPHGVISFPFGDQQNIEDWYDISGIGSLQLDVQAGSGMASTDSCQILLQQLRKYA